MSQEALQVVAAAGFALLAVAAAWVLRLGLTRELAWAALRAAVQLTVVGAIIALVFHVEVLAFAFVAAMLLTAALTSGGRLRVVPGARRRVAVAIGVPALAAVGFLLLIGAFDATPQAAVPAAGILIGGAMTAATITGRRLVEGLEDEEGEIEARLSLGDDAHTALRPVLRRAITTGLVPAIDQTRSVGLVTLPGTFVGLVLGGASPASAARVQLLILLALLAVELFSALIIGRLLLAAVVAPRRARGDPPVSARRVQGVRERRVARPREHVRPRDRRGHRARGGGAARRRRRRAGHAAAGRRLRAGHDHRRGRGPGRAGASASTSRRGCSRSAGRAIRASSCSRPTRRRCRSPTTRFDALVGGFILNHLPAVETARRRGRAGPRGREGAWPSRCGTGRTATACSAS